MTLHGDGFARADGNCPVHRHGGRTVALFSHYLPVGHTWRRDGAALETLGRAERVVLADDPAPSVGKWIEATWRDPAGRLYGWYHAEEPVAQNPRLFVPHLGAVVSDDGGLTWRCLGTVLRAPASQIDPNAANGFVTGGYGDVCALPDRAGRHVYLHFSSYVAEDAAQGVAAARYPVGDRDRFDGAIEVWADGGWRAPGAGLPSPIWRAERSWRHADPCGYWGPAIHYNRDLDAYVMLLNRAEGGWRDLRQEGIYVSFNRDIGDPAGWSPPVRVVRGGGWYPQAVGLGRADGDALSGATARLFFCGFSAWTVTFALTEAPAATEPLVMTRPSFKALFGDRGQEVVA